MSTSNDRVEQFKADIEALKIKDPAASKDGVWLALGALLMLVGIIVAIVAYFMSHGTDSALTQNDAVVLALLGVVLGIVGGALFLRYSFAGFMKFWLARLIYERRQSADD